MVGFGKATTPSMLASAQTRPEGATSTAIIRGRRSLRSPASTYEPEKCQNSRHLRGRAKRGEKLGGQQARDIDGGHRSVEFRVEKFRDGRVFSCNPDGLSDTGFSQ